MSTIKIKVPVDYDYSQQHKKNVLKYDTVEIEEESIEKFNRFEQIINDIFKIDEPHAIARKLRKLIEDSYFNDEIMKFFNFNQWLLRFAYSSDVINITSDKDFISRNVILDFPKDCYIDSKVRKIFTRKISIPIWREKKALRIKQYIEWLVLDDKNTVAEKLEVSVLSDPKETRALLINNPWILMQVENNRRINIMRNLNINMSRVDMIKGFEIDEDGFINYKRESSVVPEDLSLDYDYQIRDIKMLIESQEGTFDSRLFDYYYAHVDYKTGEDNNDLLRENLWLLDYATSRTREILIKSLGLAEVRNTVKFHTVEKRRIEGDIHSCIREVDSADLEHYEILNRQLLALLMRKDASAPLDEVRVVEFIKSDEEVLKLWPWLIEYVKEPKYITEILDSFDKPKKR